MKTAHNGLYIGRAKKLIALYVGVKVLSLGAAGVAKLLWHDYVNRRLLRNKNKLKLKHVPYDPDFNTFMKQATKSQSR